MEKLQDIQEIIEQLKQICSRYNQVKKLVVYGSRARGDNKKTSDIDLCFFGELEEYRYKIIEDIEELMTYYSFDIVFYEQLEKESLKESINRDGISIYER